MYAFCIAIAAGCHVLVQAGIVCPASRQVGVAATCLAMVPGRGDKCLHGHDSLPAHVMHAALLSYGFHCQNGDAVHMFTVQSLAVEQGSSTSSHGTNAAILQDGTGYPFKF